MRVFVTGGTGLIGRRLVSTLCSRGDHVVLLTRSTSRAAPCDPDVIVQQGDPTVPGEWQSIAAQCEVVINLAGENLLARRWNTEHKARVRESRLQATRNVVEAIRRSEGRCRTLVSASAIGYYGSRGDEVIDETTGPGSDFLAEVCKAWENEAAGAARWGARVVCVRIGVVLDPDGGALAHMIPAFRRFVGGPIGSGRQWMSWIHVDDLVDVFCRAIDDRGLSGPVNATAPTPVTNCRFASCLGRAMCRPSVFRMPAFMLRLLLGEASSVILSSQRVLPKVLLTRDHRFRFDNLNAALDDLLGQAAPRNV